MQSPTQITVRGMPKSDALEAHIKSRVTKLDKIFAQITSCHVVVELPHQHLQQGKEFKVSIDLNVPHDQIVISNEHQDAYLAMRDAFDAVERKLKSYVQRLRGEIKHHHSDEQCQA